MNKTEKGNIGKELTPRQIRAIPYLIGAPSVEAGCRNAGITDTCYYSWMQNPSFAGALAEARETLVADQMEKLRSSVGTAIDQLIALVNSKNEETRRKACNDVIALALRWREMCEVDQRLETIEKIILERRTYHR